MLLSEPPTSPTAVGALAMLTPEKKYVRIMEIVGNAVSIIGILAIADLVRNWITGG